MSNNDQPTIGKLPVIDTTLTAADKAGLGSAMSPLTPPPGSDLTKPQPSSPKTPTNLIPLPMDSTPLVLKSSGADPYTSMHYVRNKRIERLASDMESKFVGPMPVDTFLKTFLPFSAETLKQKRPWLGDEYTRLAKVSDVRGELAMYQPLIDSLNTISNLDLEFVDTHAHPDTEAGVLVLEPLKPDITAYAAGYMKKHPKKVTNFSELEVHIEVKFDENDDPFRDESRVPFEHDSDQSRETMGQITSYAVAQFASQFRTHIFSVLIFPKYVRLFRWDRGGAIVTEAFDLASPEHPFLEFLWRYSMATKRVRGMDTTVERPSKAEAEIVRDKLDLDNNVPLFKFRMDESDLRTYFIGMATGLRRNTSPTGRATRTFIVWDMRRERVSFLKDTWRIDMPDMEMEGQIIKKLHAAGVPHIPHVYCFGDVEDQRTRTHLYAREAWVKLPAAGTRPRVLHPHIHYRQAMKEIGRDLTSFNSSFEFVTAARDAFLALKTAYDALGILHRDVSSGNILISNDGRGLLIDWEMAKQKDSIVARQGERSGTWQFTSVRLLKASTDLDKPPVHKIEDDMEAFLHVLSWVSLRFLPSSTQKHELKRILNDVFDASYRNDAGHFNGGRVKKWFLTSQGIEDFDFNNPPLTSLLTDLARLFAVQYKNAPSAHEIQKYKKHLATAPAETVDYLNKTHFVGMYLRNHLDDAKWILERLDEALADRTAWPAGDKSSENLLPDVPGLAISQKDCFENSDDDMELQDSPIHDG